MIISHVSSYLGRVLSLYTIFYVLMAFALGGVASYAMPPYSYYVLLFVCLSGLYVMLADDYRPRFKFLLSYVFFFSYFLFGLLWVGDALLIEGNPYRWAWPLAVCGLPLILAPFPALGLYIWVRIADIRSLAGFFAFAAILAFFEWLRGHLFTGFPWNLLGYAWVETLSILQSVSWGSVYTLTLFTIFWASVPGYVFICRHKPRQAFLVISLAIMTFTVFYIWGWQRLHSYKPEVYHHVVAHVVQPNIRQTDKWNPGKAVENFFTLLRLSYPIEDKSVNKSVESIIIWPETALSERMYEVENYRRLLVQMLQSYSTDVQLVTGMLRYPKSGDSYRNSLVVINQNGEITQTYDKHHLVPFGEYIPYQNLIPLKPVVEFSGFQSGSSKLTLPLNDNLTFSPLICYEVIFPGDVVKSDGTRPDLLINITNDAWYGLSAGPYQHFAQARVRAIEEGVPLIRSANTGISALVSPLGHIIKKTDLEKKAVFVKHLPQNLDIPVRGFYKTVVFFGFILLFALPCFVSSFSKTHR